jgi:hypothetical protein
MHALSKVREREVPMRSRLLLIALLGLGITWAGFDWVQSSRAADAAQRQDAAELQRLRNETEQLRVSLAAVEQRLQQNEQKPKGAPVALPPELVAQFSAMKASVATARAPQPVPNPEQERKQQLQYANYLDDQLAHSAPTGADDVAATISTKLDAVLEADAKVLDLRCGKDLCRVKTRHANADAYRAFQARGFRQEQRVWAGPITFVILEEPSAPDQPLVAAMYFGRGEALPSPDPPK